MRQPTNKTSRAPRFSRALYVLTLINLALLLLLYICQTFIAERHWLTTSLTYVPQFPFGVPALILLVWSIVRRQRASLLTNAFALTFFAFALLGLNIPWRNITRPTGTPLRVMTYNIHHASTSVNQVAEIIKQAEPDVVCLQEANSHSLWPRDPLPSVMEHFRGWHVARSGDVATLSRYPIVSQRSVRLSPGTDRVVLATVIKCNGREVNVLNTHLSAGAGPESIRTRKRAIRAYLARCAGIRGEQIATVLEVARGTTGPVVITGDFNTPPRGLVYRGIAGQYQDAFAAAGWGFGYTFRSDTPVLRIDYIFTGRGTEPTSCRTVRSASSDHRALVADLAIAAPAHKDSLARSSNRH